jgi:lipid II:glycine glycyltransferase (peptidoglycan interpeptide bridge formation enzyme)
VRKGAKKAIVAISHKLIIAAYQVLKKKEAYKSPLLNNKQYEEKQKVKSVQKHLVELSKLGFTVRLTPVN